MKILLVSLAAVVPFISGCGLFSEETLPTKVEEIEKVPVTKVDNYSTTTSVEKTTTTKPTTTINLTKNKTMETFDSNKQYAAIVKTSVGDFTITFHKGQTPKTVENFITLAKKGFYDNTIFHRVIKGFMVQGGDPKGDGTGGPGYKFADEKFNAEYVRGAVAMANSGPNTNGSQFFVMHATYPLPKNYIIFGNVTSGMETVDKIAEAEVEYSAFGELSKPVKPVKVLSVTVSEK